MKTLIRFALVACLPVAAASAQTLAQKNMIAQDKIQVAERAAATNKKCGTDIKFSMDYPTFYNIKGDPTNPNDQSPWAFFANVTDALDSVCGTDDGKAAVKAKIHSVVVSHATAESESMSGGTFHYSVPYNGAGVQTIIAWLGKNL